MTRMRSVRIMLVLMVVGLTPLVMGAGGGNPGVPSDKKIGGPMFTANIVLDPHEAGVTSTAKRATIRLSHNQNTAAALFTIPPLFPLDNGCDLTLTDTRFLTQPLSNWIDLSVLTPLFANLGVTISPTTMDPVIVQILNDDCTADPANPGPLSGGSKPGILSFQARVRFLLPK